MDDRQRAPVDTLKELPPLMPQFLRARRTGFIGGRALAERLGLDPSAFSTLLSLHRLQGAYEGKPVTLAQMRARDPYRAIDIFSDPLSTLLEKGLVVEDSEEGYFLTPYARQAMHDLHAAATAHLSSLSTLPESDLQALAQQLDRAVEAVVADPTLAPRPGSHLMEHRALRALGPDAPAIARVDQAIFELWGARDDAHLRAWRDANLEGPPLEALTILWLGEAHTVQELQTALAHNQTPTDLESSLAYLLDKDYITRDNNALALTPSGVLVREDIERETDRLYFTPWPHTQGEAEWMVGRVRGLVETLQTTDDRP